MPAQPDRQAHTHFATHANGSIGSRRGRGFTLVDLLVSMVVVGILVSILAPSMMKSYEMARRVVCASNVKQIGYALDMYIDDNNDELPRSVYLQRRTPTSSGDIQNSMFLRIAHGGSLTTNTLDNQSSSTVGNAVRWDGLGFLFELDYLSHPGVFYCPSHHGEHDFDRYRESWNQHSEEIAGNFQYRVDPNYRLRSELPNGITLVADAMRTQQDYNHIQGNNMLRGDLSVAWYEDLNGVLYNNLPNSGDESSAATSVVQAWKVLDEHNGIPDAELGQIGGPITAGSDY